MYVKFFIPIVLLFLSVNVITAQEEENVLTWPREIDSEKGTVTLYQPQLESFKSNILEGRMALSFKPVDGDMIFGAVWFKARMSTDMDDRTVRLESIEVPRVNFPDMENKEKVDRFTDLLIKEVESWNLVMSLDRLLAGMSEVEEQKNLSVQINNDPPDIYFRSSPSVLISIDGEPKLKVDESSKLEYVLNTPFFIVKEQKGENYYIKNGKFWYVSSEILKGWKETEKVPSKIEKFAEGTKRIADALVKATESGAYTLVGGGDTVAAVKKYKISRGDSIYINDLSIADYEAIKRLSKLGVKCIVSSINPPPHILDLFDEFMIPLISGDMININFWDDFPYVDRDRFESLVASVLEKLKQKKELEEERRLRMLFEEYKKSRIKELKDVNFSRQN